MSEFLTSLDGRWLTDDRFMLLAPLSYKSDLYRGVITVPAGFVTDFASVPRVPLLYTLFGDRAHHESVPHDYLYQTHLVPKAEADNIFLESMVVRGKSWFVREGMYAGVVLGGKSSYLSGPCRLKILNPSITMLPLPQCASPVSP